jgi:hypothetical protein
MKLYLCFLILLIFSGCKNETEIKSEIKIVELLPNKQQKTNKIQIYKYNLNIKDSLITNNSKKEIDVLINGVGKFLGGKNLNLGIHSECIGCEPVEEFNGNLVFAKQLFISKDEITFYPNEINNSTKKIRIKTQTCDSEKTNKFNFIGGNAKIKFAKVSCNDSNLNDVMLDYGKENITIKSMINATFFEYDIDKNGRNEQYLIGTRNCSQEIVILRIRDKNE